MKKSKIFILLIGLIFCSNISYAQEDNSGNEMDGSNWGLKFGGSRHWQVQESFKFDSDNGFLFGMYFLQPRGKFIATSYEWQVMQLGYRINETTDPNLDRIVINRTYIHALFNLHITPAEFIEVSLGGYAGFAATSNEKWYYDTGLEERDEESNLRQFDAGAKLSATFWLKKLGIGLEYYHGIVNTDSETGPDFVFTNRAISLSAKYIMEQ